MPDKEEMKPSELSEPTEVNVSHSEPSSDISEDGDLTHKVDDTDDVNALRKALNNIALGDMEELIPWTDAMTMEARSEEFNDRAPYAPEPERPLNDGELSFIRRWMSQNPVLEDDEECVPFGLDKSGDPIYEPGPRGKALRKIKEQHVHPKSKLSEDSFSFLISSRTCSTPYTLGAIVFVLKGLLFTLICINLIDLNNGENLVGIPAGVAPGVAVSQFLAMFIAVASQDDLRTAVNYAFEGYDPQNLGEAYVGATRMKWIIAVSLQFLEGAFGLATTFLLIIESDEVVGLVLDFTAVEFITLLDNTAFVLANQGFMGRINKLESELIMNTEYSIPPKRQKTMFRQISTMLGTFAILLLSWSIIFSRQLQGKFMPQTIMVQFDDELRPELGAYSGNFDLRILFGRLSVDRVSYEPRNGDGFIGYCITTGYWTFSMSGSDPCYDYAARSSDTWSYDITASSEFQWYATEDSQLQRFFPMDSFLLQTTCEVDIDCGGVGKGVCVDDSCVCNEGFYGVRCDYEVDEACDTIVVDERLETFRGGRQFASEYNLLRDARGDLVRVYHHPVYVAEPRNSEGLDIMMYIGIRWALCNSLEALPQLSNHTLSDLAAYLSTNDFHAATHLKSLSFFTEQVIFNTPDDTDAPVGKAWFNVIEADLVNTERVGAIDSLMICAVCHNSTNRCQNGNMCIDGACQCTNGAEGSLCQITPVSNGKCDPFFNIASYKYDGGDCCQATCVSTGDYTCGIVTAGVLRSVDVGFPYCSDPTVIRECDDEQCWTPTSSAPDTFSNEVTTLTTISDNGRILIVAAPDLDIVYVYDQVGSEWIQRGPLLDGSPGSQFGKQLAISTLPGTIVGRRYGRIPILLAMASHDNNTARVRVVRWKSNAIDWSAVSDELEICGVNETMCGIVTLDIGRFEDEITLSVVRSDNQVQIYRTRLSENDCSEPWALTGTINGALDAEEYGIYQGVSLSGETKILAVTRNETMDIFFRRTGTEDFDLQNKIVRNITSDISRIYREIYSDISTPTGIESVVSVEVAFDESAMIIFCEGEGGLDFVTRYEFAPRNSRPWFTAQPIAADHFVAANLLETEIENGLSLARFSADASSAAIRVNTTEGRKIRLLSYNRQTRRFEPKGFSGGQLKPRYQALTNDFIDRDGDFGLSHDGDTYVQVGESGPESYMMVPVCGKSEVHYRISLTLDEHPSNISWALESYQMLGNHTFRNTTFQSCDRCYIGEERYGMGIVAENVCVQAEDDPCTRVRFQTSIGLRPGAGIVSFRNGTELARYTGSETEPFFAVSSPDDTSACGISELKCDNDEVQILVEMNLDNFSSDNSWALTNTRGTVVLSGDNYGVKDDRTTKLSQACASKNEEFVFNILDASGDGMCCNFGQGGFGIYIDDEEIYSLSVARNFLRSRIAFNSMGVIFAQSVPVIVEIQPNEGTSSGSGSIVSLDGSEVWWERDIDPNANLTETVYLTEGVEFRLMVTGFDGNYNMYWGLSTNPESMLFSGDTLSSSSATVLISNTAILQTNAPVTSAPVFSPVTADTSSLSNAPASLSPVDSPVFAVATVLTNAPFTASPVVTPVTQAPILNSLLPSIG